MRLVPVCLMVTLLLASPVLACGRIVDVADSVRAKFTMIDKALSTGVAPGNSRAQVETRRAEAERLLQEGATLRSKTADQAKEPATTGIRKQFEASRIADGIMRDLKLPIPRLFHC